MADLEAKLQEASGARVKLIATDGTTPPGLALLPFPGYDLLLHAAGEGFVTFISFHMSCTCPFRTHSQACVECYVHQAEGSHLTKGLLLKESHAYQSEVYFTGNLVRASDLYWCIRCRLQMFQQGFGRQGLQLKPCERKHEILEVMHSSGLTHLLSQKTGCSLL